MSGRKMRSARTETKESVFGVVRCVRKDICYFKNTGIKPPVSISIIPIPISITVIWVLPETGVADSVETVPSGPPEATINAAVVVWVLPVSERMLATTLCGPGLSAVVGV
jgi:hypothetical protein